MAEFEQANVRVPPGAKEAIGRLARLLRENPTFIHRLNRFLDEEQNPEIGALISQRLDRLERRVADILGQASPEVAGAVDELPPGQDQIWTVGEGKGRRLTDEGNAEALRLIDEGLSDAQIAKRLGVTSFSIATRRKKRNMASAEASEDEGDGFL